MERDTLAHSDCCLGCVHGKGWERMDQLDFIQEKRLEATGRTLTGGPSGGIWGRHICLLRGR